MRLTVFVADAQPLLSESLSIALGCCSDLAPVEERSTFAADAIEAVSRQRPDVVLLDYWMPGIDGPESSEKVLRELEGFKVIFLSWFFSNKPWFDPPGDIERVIAAGAVGFLPKHIRVSQLADAIRRAHKGEAPVLADALQQLIERMRGRRKDAGEFLEQLGRLTPRETQILELLAQGTTIADAAAALYISPATLRTHVQRILQKTGTHSQRAAVATARNFGIIRG